MNRVKVDQERWNKAQEWEKSFWLRSQKSKAKYGKNYARKLLNLLKSKDRKFIGDDWNYWWKEKFADYSFLPPSVENAIELGCGPFTNMRIITQICKVNHLVLSDPLIKTYLTFRDTFVSKMYKGLGCTIDDHPIEEIPYLDNYFDLTVMINVLDHVKDAEACMIRAIDITKKDGILIIGQDLTSEEDLKNNEKMANDLGHPIRLDHNFLDKFLTEKFEKLEYKILSREEGRNLAHYGTYIFAGKKL